MYNGNMKSNKNKPIPAIVWQEGKLFVAKTLGLELASQGKTKKEALKNLQEALDLLLEDEEHLSAPEFLPQDPQIKHIYA